MTLYELLLIIGSLLSATLAFLWLAVKMERVAKYNAVQTKKSKTLAQSAKEDVERVFNEEFREELRNRGRLYFEKIINENAMFLQQDLRLTTSQINDFMKEQIKKTLTEEFSKYEESIAAAKELALQSISKTQQAIEQQRAMMQDQIKTEFQAEKERRLKEFDVRMSEVISHYLLVAVGDQIDLSEQMEYIISELNENKKSIIEDIRNGA